LEYYLRIWVLFGLGFLYITQSTLISNCKKDLDPYRGSEVIGGLESLEFCNKKYIPCLVQKKIAVEAFARECAKVHISRKDRSCLYPNINY
jgi:hypothetical protein